MLERLFQNAVRPREAVGKKIIATNHIVCQYAETTGIVLTGITWCAKALLPHLTAVEITVLYAVVVESQRLVRFYSINVVIQIALHVLPHAFFVILCTE